MYRPNIYLYYDASTQSLINSDGTTSNVSTPSLYIHNEYMILLQIYSDYPTVQNLSTLNNWKNGIGLVGGLTDPPLVETLDADINTDPWANEALGKISIIANTHSSALVAAMGTSETKQYKSELKGNDGTNYVTISLSPVFCKNTVYED